MIETNDALYCGVFGGLERGPNAGCRADRNGFCLLSDNTTPGTRRPGVFEASSRQTARREIMTGLNKLQLPGIDLGAAKKMAGSAMAAIKQGPVGYD
jgi:hypothetical protein